MLLGAIKRYPIKVISSNEEIIYEGQADDLPETLKKVKVKKVSSLTGDLLTLEIED